MADELLRSTVWRATFGIKHCEGDFHWNNPFSGVIGQGCRSKVIERQRAREHEGNGAYPNCVANGVIDGYEEPNLRATGTKFPNFRE